MVFKVWWIWMIFAAIFTITEIFTAGFFIFWFGIGAAVAGIFAILGFGLGWQWGAFIIVSSVLFAISRRFAEQITRKQPLGIGADRFVGKKGLVLEEVNNIKNTGRVRVEKEDWWAVSDSGEVIQIGKQVEVITVVGTHLIVKTLKEGAQDGSTQ